MILYRNAVQSLVPEGTIFETILDENGWRIGKWGSPEVSQPTEEAIQAKLKELETEYDSKKYQRDRADAYPELKEQLDLLWHAIDDGKFNVKSKETDFYKKLKAVKDANPKPE